MIHDRVSIRKLPKKTVIAAPFPKLISNDLSKKSSSNASLFCSFQKYSNEEKQSNYA